MNFKKLFWAIGPLTLSLIVIACLFLFDIKLPLSKEEISFQATARNYSTIKGEYVRNQILSDKKYIPFYSSSEMAIIDEFHPNMLAEKYDRNYRPYIAGRDAQGALTHFLEMRSTSDNHYGKKIVYILSPNSFQNPEGIQNPAYETVHSRQEISNWLLGINEPTKEDQFIAKRLLSYKVVQNDKLLAPRINKIEEKESLSTYDNLRLQLKYRRLRAEDNLFSNIEFNRSTTKKLPQENEFRGMNNFVYAQKYKMDNLPDTYNIDELDKLAYKIGKDTSKNNDFGFFDVKYKKDIGKNLSTFKNSREDKTYTNSREFNDFQLVLNEISTLKMDPLFIFIPINDKWIDYTKTPRTETDGVVEKIKYQLNSQGFTNFLEVDGTRDYSYVDAAHAGRRAWVQIDKTVNSFLSDSETNSHDFKLNNELFFSDKWAKEKIELK